MVCYQCNERIVGCHSTCPKYIEERAERDKFLADRYKRHESEYTSNTALSNIRRQLNDRKMGKKNY